MAVDKLKVGIIGCGGIAEVKHFPAMAKQKHRIELVGFCDIEEARAEDAKARFGDAGATHYTDYRKLLDDKTIDVVYVLTPNVSHAEITVAALHAGKHVLCEKPMAPTTADAQAMLDAVKATGKKLTIGYQNRYRSDSQILHQACRAGDLGDIYFAKAHAVRRRGVPTWGVFPDKSKQGGGPLIDLATHALDLALWMMDNYEPAMVLGTTFEKMRNKFEGNWFGPWDPKTFEVEDSAFGFVKMKNGATIFIESAWALNVARSREGQVTLCGTEAGAELVGDGAAAPNSSIHSGDVIFNQMKYNQQLELVPTPVSPMVKAHMGEHGPKVGDAELNAWLDAIINDTEPYIKPAEAYVVTQILDAIYKSAAEGRAIQL
jgi:predicted dehydrogenase